MHMNVKKQLLQLKSIAAELEESDKELMQDFIRQLEKGKTLEEPDECVDFLLGVAAECEDVQQQAIYDVIDYIQEM